MPKNFPLSAKLTILSVFLFWGTMFAGSLALGAKIGHDLVSNAHADAAPHFGKRVRKHPRT